MLTIADPKRYAEARALRDIRSRRDYVVQEVLMPVVLFGSAGAIAWAVRGTSGWGGIDGAVVPGMLWAILWYWQCWRKGIAADTAPLWLGLGIALGGELGYGQYVSWIRGSFYAGDTTLPVATWIGWAWFFLCGLAWCAPGGVLLGWAIGGKASWRIWSARLVVPMATAVAGWILVQWWPGLFFPNYGLGIYGAILDKHLARAVYTNTQNFTVVAWWAGALLTALVQRDKPTAVMALVIGGGFGLGFMISAAWCLGYVYAPDFIDWWKVWELQAGFNLGALIALAQYWCVRETDRAYSSSGAWRAQAPEPDSGQWRMRTALETAAAVLFLLATYIEREIITSATLAFVYLALAAGFIVAGRHMEAAQRAALRNRLTQLYCVFLFLFVAWNGATLRLGVVLELYPSDAVAQYDWPLPRLWLFVPVAAVLVSLTLYQGAKLLLHPHASHDATRLDIRLADLITGLALIGAISIWPSEIGILYAACLSAAVAARNRIV